MSDINQETIENILQYSPSEKLFIKALNVYKIRKSNVLENGIILLLCTIFSIIIGININVVLLVTNSVSIFLNVSIALFGITFTGYAIFQTLLSDRLTISLFKNTNGTPKSKLQETNENFVYLMILFIFGITVNVILSILIPVVPSDYCLFNNSIVNCITAVIAIDALFYVMGVTFWRMVSFISNIYHLFNAYAVSNLLDAMENKEHEQKE